MKKLLIVLALTLFSCSSDSEAIQEPDTTCYSIIARGVDERGNYIIINVSDFNQRRYLVPNYLDYIGQSQLCEPITLTQQPL